MKRRWAVRLAAVLVVAVVVHLLVIAAAPRVVMREATRRIADRAGGSNAWVHAERVTPRNQEVVRSSPDLAYSACAWDLSDGPVRITAPAWEGYFSLSLYDARTDNFLVVNDRDTEGEGADVVLATSEQAADLGGGVRIVEAPSRTGVALLRYLAPTATEHERADAVRRSAMCTSWSP